MCLLAVFKNVLGFAMSANQNQAVKELCSSGGCVVLLGRRLPGLEHMQVCCPRELLPARLVSRAGE
jgi:hypothetical protein